MSEFIYYIYKFICITFEFLAATESKVKTKIVVADFTQGVGVYDHIERELADLPIAILGMNLSQILSIYISLSILISQLTMWA